MFTVASSGSLLREARARAGLSQVQLAAVAGLTQSVVSAYEAGRRQPSLLTLTRLIEATGSDLELALIDRLRRLDGPLGIRVRRHRTDLIRTAAKYGASNLRVFGSVARGEESESSDVDLLVDLSENVGLFGLAQLERELAGILAAPVEVIPAADLKPGVKENVTRDLVTL